MKALRKIAPAWHGEAKTLLAENFAKIHHQFIDSTKRAVWLGAFLNHIKLRGKQDKSIPHGEFGPWIKTNFPDLHWDTLCTYMRLARDVCEKGKIQISEFPKFGDCPQLPNAILKIVEGKTQFELCLEFKQCKENEDGEFEPARGRRVGEGGNAGKNASPEAHRRWVLGRVGRGIKELDKIGCEFVLLEDKFCELLLADLERRTQCLQAWLRQPLGQRDISAIQKLWDGR